MDWCFLFGFAELQHQRTMAVLQVGKLICDQVWITGTAWVVCPRLAYFALWKYHHSPRRKDIFATLLIPHTTYVWDFDIFLVCGDSSDDLWHWTCSPCVVSSVWYRSGWIFYTTTTTTTYGVATAVSNTRFLSAITDQNDTKIIRNANTSCSLCLYFSFPYTTCARNLFTFHCLQWFRISISYKCALLCFRL